MRRSFEISGDTLIYVFYGLSLAALAPLLASVAFPLDSFANVAFAALIALLLGAVVIGMWRRWTDREGEHLGTAEDIAYDPFGDPGHGAKQSWENAVRRLPGGDDDED